MADKIVKAGPKNSENAGMDADWMDPGLNGANGHVNVTINVRGKGEESKGKYLN